MPDKNLNSTTEKRESDPLVDAQGVDRARGFIARYFSETPHSSAAEPPPEFSGVREAEVLGWIERCSCSWGIRLTDAGRIELDRMARTGSAEQAGKSSHHSHRSHLSEISEALSRVDAAHIKVMVMDGIRDRVERLETELAEARDTAELEIHLTERELTKANKRLEKNEARIDSLRSSLEDARTASNNNRDGLHRLLCLDGDPTWSAVRREVARLSNYVITDDADGLRVELREVPEDCAIRPEPRDNDCDGISPLCFPAIKASVPEPDPKPNGVEVTPGLVAWLRDRGMNYVAGIVEARDAFGREKYGQPLMTDDGRDAVEDCRQELGDALQYAWSAKLCGDDVTGLLGPAQALVQLLFDEKVELPENEALATDIDLLTEDEAARVIAKWLNLPVTIEPGIEDPEAALMAAAIYVDVTESARDESGVDRDVLMACADVEPEPNGVEVAPGIVDCLQEPGIVVDIAADLTLEPLCYPAVTTTPEPEPEPEGKLPMTTASNEVLDTVVETIGEAHRHLARAASEVGMMMEADNPVIRDRREDDALSSLDCASLAIKRAHDALWDVDVDDDEDDDEGCATCVHGFEDACAVPEFPLGPRTFEDGRCTTYKRITEEN